MYILPKLDNLHLTQVMNRKKEKKLTKNDV